MGYNTDYKNAKDQINKKDYEFFGSIFNCNKTDQSKKQQKKLICNIRYFKIFKIFFKTCDQFFIPNV